MKMRRIGWFLLAIFFVACGTTIRSADVTYYDRSVTSAEVRQWQRFGIDLPANIVGSRWRLDESLDETVVTLIGTEIAEQSNIETWLFRGEGLGVTTIRMAYGPTGSDITTDTHRLTIRVRYGGVSCSSSS